MLKLPLHSFKSKVIYLSSLLAKSVPYLILKGAKDHDVFVRHRILVHNIIFENQIFTEWKHRCCSKSLIDLILPLFICLVAFLLGFKVLHIQLVPSDHEC